MTKFELLQQLAENFSLERLDAFLRAAHQDFRPTRADLTHHNPPGSPFDAIQQVGQIDFPDSARIIIVAVHLEDELTTRSSRKAQYDLAKNIVKEQYYNAGLFIFYDDSGHTRFSLVVARYKGVRQEFSNFRRYTYYVSPDLPNKTFLNQVSKADFSSLEGLLHAFSIEAVSDEFYNEFEPHFDALQNAVQGTTDEETRKAFALLLVMRLIFTGFVQKKRWIGGSTTFIQDFLAEYQRSFRNQDLFYRDWLNPLFFEALNHAPGYNIYSNLPFSEEIKQALLMSPFLNGELFKRKEGIDDQGWLIADTPIVNFIEFLFSYNFTVEENTIYDEELELNPEFLGIIFERLVNKADGAIYTPRTEVDLMCRLGLVKWLGQNNTSGISDTDLYNFVFRNFGREEEFDQDQKRGDFSAHQIEELIRLLENLSVCDPAAGSGAFEVGMLHVLAELIEDLYERPQTPLAMKEKKPSDFELKKAIIANCLYGVDVKRWAVWINHLRLWLTLFVDMPVEYQQHSQPLLPNLTFKVRTGDSLVQRVGERAFPVQGQALLSNSLRKRLEQLKILKRDFFFNCNVSVLQIEQEEVAFFSAILDEQIEQKRERLNSLMQPTLKQDDWLDEDRIKQLDLAEEESNRQASAVLQSEILALQIQKRNLKEDRPFLWSVEFCEVFLERGGFDIIIGNPPYVRQESISDPNRRLGAGEYKAALKEMCLLDFPDYFARSQRQQHLLKEGRKPSGRSDLYTYFYIRSLRLLNEKGLHVFICSNSWLDVGYGAWLQEFLLRSTPIHFIIDNHAKRSFANSDVNTIISILGAPKREANLENQVRFVAFKKPFEDAVFAENLLCAQTATKTEKIEDLRVFPIKQSALLREGTQIDENNHQRYVGDKWGGKYLRAPDIYFTILEKGAGKLVRLGDIAEVSFGIKTGANDFFYLRPHSPGSATGLLRVQNGAGWIGEIEEEYLKPVIKSPRECRTIRINPNDLQFRIFMCHKTKAELKGSKALEYIKWGERRGYHERPSCRNRSHWWWLPEIKGNIFLGKELRDRLGFFNSDDEIYVDCRLYTTTNSEKIHQLLNSTIALFISEIMSRQYGGGGGPRSVMVYEANNYLLPVEDALNIEDGILESSRELLSIFHECGCNDAEFSTISNLEINPLPDRRKLDQQVFKYLELNKEEIKEVYCNICKVVWDRINKAENT